MMPVYAVPCPICSENTELKIFKAEPGIWCSYMLRPFLNLPVSMSAYYASLCLLVGNNSSVLATFKADF